MFPAKFIKSDLQYRFRLINILKAINKEQKNALTLGQN